MKQTVRRPAVGTLFAKYVRTRTGLDRLPMAHGHPSSQWFVRDSSGVRGPISEADLRKIVKQSSDPRLQVRQGNSPWYPAAVVRKKIDELEAGGIYIRFANVAEGPFTMTRAVELLKTVSSEGVRVRTGKTGKWVSATQWIGAIERLQRKRKRESQSVAGAQGDGCRHPGRMARVSL